MNVMFNPLNGAASAARLPWHPPRIVELPPEEADEARTRLAQQDELAEVDAHASGLVSAEPPQEAETSPGISLNNPPSTAPLICQARPPVPKPSRAGIFNAAASENRRALYLAQRNSLVRAIRDPELSHRHRVILAEIIMVTNTQTGVAFPGYKALAEATGYSKATVELTTTELLKWRFLASTRKAAEPGGRALAHYTVIKPTMEQLQAAITAHIMAQRKPKAVPNPALRNTPDPNPSVRDADPNPNVGNTPAVPNIPRPKSGSVPNPVAGTVTRSTETRRGSGADAPAPASNGKAAMAAALGGQVAYAHRNIIISESGNITIGDEFRAELRETYNDSQIERCLARAPAQAGCSDPVKLLAQIRRCCSFAKQDDELHNKKLAAMAKGQSTRKTYER
jgi:hypothetical protein